MLLQIFVYKFLYGQMFSVLLGIYLRVDWLDHVVTVINLFKGLPGCFPTWLHRVMFLQAVNEGFYCSLSSFTLVVVCLLT